MGLRKLSSLVFCYKLVSLAECDHVVGTIDLRRTGPIAPGYDSRLSGLPEQSHLSEYSFWADVVR